MNRLHFEWHFARSYRWVATETRSRTHRNTNPVVTLGDFLLIVVAVNAEDVELLLDDTEGVDEEEIYEDAVTGLTASRDSGNLLSSGDLLVLLLLW